MTVQIAWGAAAIVVIAVAIVVFLVNIMNKHGLSHETRNECLSQICSGRWILTVMSGMCLVMLTMALIWKGPENSVSPEALVAIISTVFTSYFYKDRNSDGDNGGGGGGDPIEVDPPADEPVIEPPAE